MIETRIATESEGGKEHLEGRQATRSEGGVTTIRKVRLARKSRVFRLWVRFIGNAAETRD